MLQNDIRILRSDEPGAEIAAQLQAVINGNPGEVYFDKPYLVTTENQRFIGKILPPDANHVASILGSVDNVFECVARRRRYHSRLGHQQFTKCCLSFETGKYFNPFS